MAAFAGAGNIGPGVMNYAIPVLIGAVGLTGAYSEWPLLVGLVAGLYTVFGVNPYYFQLVQKGLEKLDRCTLLVQYIRLAKSFSTTRCPSRVRLIQVLVPEAQLEAIAVMLDDEGVDYVRQQAWSSNDEYWLVQFPVPTDAIGHMLDRLEAEGIDTDQYTTITSLETAMTSQSEPLQERFAEDFDPLTRSELRSKARDMSHDTRSFLAMIFLSAIIAVAGLLIESPAVVVGSMVIAPIVGPVLTAAVGAATGDKEMLLHSVWIQAAGLTVAIVGAGAFSFGLQFAGFFPESLDVTTIDLIALRIAPNLVTIVIGLAAGAAGAFGLTTKGPTSLIGVMIAAALIPAAATVGIATAWTEYRIAVGSLLLLLLTMIAINGGSFLVLWWLEYRPEQDGWLFPSRWSVQWVLVVGTALLLITSVGLVSTASSQQIAFERTVNGEIQQTFDKTKYEDVEPVAVRIQYSGIGPFGSPETITITASRTDDGSDPPTMAVELDQQITDATDHEVDIRIRFMEYQRSNDDTLSETIDPQRKMDLIECESQPSTVPSIRGASQHESHRTVL